jgi:hypothetical protein
MSVKKIITGLAYCLKKLLDLSITTYYRHVQSSDNLALSLPRRGARAEARADSRDVKATAMRHFKDHEKRIDTLEDATEIPHPDKNYITLFSSLRTC